MTLIIMTYRLLFDCETYLQRRGVNLQTMKFKPPLFYFYNCALQKRKCVHKIYTHMVPWFGITVLHCSNKTNYPLLLMVQGSSQHLCIFFGAIYVYQLYRIIFHWFKHHVHLALGKNIWKKKRRKHCRLFLSGNGLKNFSLLLYKLYISLSDIINNLLHTTFSYFKFKKYLLHFIEKCAFFANQKIKVFKCTVSQKS